MSVGLLKHHSKPIIVDNVQAITESEFAAMWGDASYNTADEAQESLALAA